MRSATMLVLVLLGCAVDPTLAPRDCTPGQTAPCACPGVDLMRDVMNCGACGNACPDRTGAAVSCVSGACRYACHGGRGDCDGDTVNGCETNLSNSPRHCGACGRACVSPFNACTTGVCIVSR